MSLSSEKQVSKFAFKLNLYRCNEAKASASVGGMYLLAIVVGMVGATYASVPLYRMVGLTS